MNHSIRSLAPQFSLFAAAAVMACMPTRSVAADVTLAAVTASQWAAEAPVQDLGRIEASGHAANVRRELARHARHPDAGSASPRQLNGKVDVAFDVGRDGAAAQATIVAASASNALNGAALRAVQRARFQPVEGEARHYVVTFDYRY